MRRITALGLMLATILFACNSSTTSGADDSDNATSTDTNVELVKLWETDTTIRTPESVEWDPQREIYYVSNINRIDNDSKENGFLSKLNKDGSVSELQWITGLEAPKGLGVYGNTLYTADVTSLVIVDIDKSEVKEKIFVPSSTFLNDVAVDGDGNVYISDSRAGKIYIYKDGAVSEFISAPETKDANGVLVWNGKLYIGAADGIYSYDFDSKDLSLYSSDVKGGDGLTPVNDSEMIASRWVGEIFYVFGDGSATKILDTKDQNSNTADIFFSKENNQLMVPTFNANRVVAYEVRK